MKARKTHFKQVQLIIILTVLLIPINLIGQNNLFEWSYKTGGNIQGSVSLSDGILYVGSFDSLLYAIDTLGMEQWTFNSHYSIQSTALIFDSVVCFQSGNRLYGLNKNTGMQLWKHEPIEVTLNEPVIMVDEIDLKDASPVLRDSVAYYGNEYGKFYGINIFSGEETFWFDTEKGYSINATATFANDTVYFGDMEGYVFAVNISNGSLIWEMRTNNGEKPYGGFGPIVGNLVIDNDLLYFGLHNGELQVLNRYTGVVAWNTGDMYATWYSGIPVIKNNIMYIGTSDSKQLVAFNATSGEELWSTPIQHGMYNAPLFHQDYIIILAGYSTYENLSHESGTGRLMILDLEGNVLNAISLPGSVFNTAVEKNGKIYFGTMDDNIYCIDLVTATSNLLSNFSFNNDTLDAGIFNSEQSEYVELGYVVNIGTKFDELKLKLSEIKFDERGVKTSPSFGKINAYDSIRIRLSVRPKYIENGNYSIKLTLQAKDNSSISIEKLISFTIDKATDIKEADPKQGLIEVFPNPFNHVLNLKLDMDNTSNLRIVFYNTQGRLIRSVFFNEKHLSIDMSDLNLEQQLLFYRVLNNGSILSKGSIMKN